MDWRYALLKHFGPGLLGGVTFGQWITLLRRHRFAITPTCWPRAMAITAQSLQNSFFRWIEERRVGSAWRETVVPAPLFVLGHWRNGTTHLHNLLTVDDRFTYPNSFQALYPDSFLTAERTRLRALQFFLPKRRPMDNIEWTMLSPQEEEFALCVATSLSPCMGWVFSSCRGHYDRYLTFRGVDEREIAEWQAAFIRFLQRVTWNTNKPLILKSPPHTARIRLLLETFPGAKFVHIHRDPFAVFRSSRKTFQINFDYHRLQPFDSAELDELLLEQHRRMYDAFFEERQLIPPGRYHELSYEDLERDRLGEVRRIYEALDLPDFGHVEPALRTYVDSVGGYEKNRFAELPADLRRRIVERWRPYCEEWGYRE